MTAYARREIKSCWGVAEWELRSVNHRYLEIHIHLPETFRMLEQEMREYIRRRLSRGKVECKLCIQLDVHVQSPMLLNKKLAKKVIEAAEWIKLQSNEGQINPLSVLSWPGVFCGSEKDLSAIIFELIQAFHITLESLVSEREREGAELKALVEQRLNGVSTEVMKVRAQMPNILQWQHDRLFGKLEEMKLKLLETSRLEQELLLMAQRIDVDEELDRLDIHVQEIYNILKKEEPIGRRLDFIMQELNREANTLASKSINAHVTNSAIELKVLIEKIREQIQNIE